MDVTAVSAIPTAKLENGRTPQDPKKIHEAAVQFESLLIGQVMKSAHDASIGDEALAGDQASGSLLDFGTQEFAQLLAERGGLGLAKLIEQGIRAKAGAQP